MVCWGYENPHLYPTVGISTHVMNHPAQPMYGPGRWLLRLRNLPNGNFYGTLGHESKTLSALLDIEKPSVLLCHFGHFALRILPVAVSKGIPIVAHFHGLDVSSALKQDRWYRWSLTRSLPRFAAVVVVGAHQEKWMLDQGVSRTRLHLIPCGAPVSEYSAHPEQPSNAVRFVAVSRLVEWKGVDLTIRAFAEVATKLQQVELLVVGDGPERHSLQSLADSLGLENRIIFAGASSAEVVRKYYQSSHVFVQHSITHSSGWVEGFGVTIVEAAASGLPVVVTRSGGVGPQVIPNRNGISDRRTRC